MTILYYTTLFLALFYSPAYALTSLSLQLGEPWDNAAALAMAEWNAVLPLLATDPSSIHSIGWDGSLTSVASTTKEAGRVIVRLNAQRCWDLYDGPQVYGFCHDRLEVILDAQRVILHELGHVLGLEHAPDGVDAIMHAETTDRATLSLDDEVRLMAMPRTAPQGPAGSGGCALGENDNGDIFFLMGALFSLMALKFFRHRADT